MYSNRHSIHLKCITYGYLGTVLRNQSLLSIQHSHVVPQSTMDATYKCHDYISPVTAISIQTDLQFTQNASHMVPIELDYIINHYCQHSIHMLSPNPPQIPHASIMFHIPPIFAISIQIDLQFTRNVSPMVSGALDYTIDLSHQYSIHLLSHN